jgi:hypothetical protein
MVAACIKAETGVGPSIASGNQLCNVNCADFPIAPTNNNRQHIDKNVISKVLQKYVNVPKKGLIEKTISKFIV